MSHQLLGMSRCQRGARSRAHDPRNAARAVLTVTSHTGREKKEGPVSSVRAKPLQSVGNQNTDTQNNKNSHYNRKHWSIPPYNSM
jgi:hypothetical protein